MTVTNSFPFSLPSISWVLAMSSSNPSLLAEPPSLFSPPSQTGSHTAAVCEEHCQVQHSIFLFVSRLTAALEHKQGLSFVRCPVVSIQSWQWRVLSYTCPCLQSSQSLFHHSLNSNLARQDRAKPFVVLFTLSATFFISWNPSSSALHYFQTNWIPYWTITMLYSAASVFPVPVS